MKRLAKRAIRFSLPVLRRLLPLFTKLEAQTVPLLSQEEKNDWLFHQIGLIPSVAGPDVYHLELYKKVFNALEPQGVHITPNHFYSPIPDTREIAASDLEKRESELVGVDLNLETQLELLCKVFPQYSEEYNALPSKASEDLPPYQFHFHNDVFDGMDALVLYAMVRHYKPRRIIEVGSGWSTMLSAQAALKNGNTELICIEPYPNEVLVNGFPGLNSLIQKRVEHVDLSLFQTLGEGDILFVDTSHAIKTNGDVNYLHLEIIPRLQKGVIVHIHDIFFPLEYPKYWLTERFLFWNEQYLVQAFLAFNSHFKTLFMNNYMRLKYLDQVKETFPNCPFYDTGQSVWIQKIK